MGAIERTKPKYVLNEARMASVVRTKREIVLVGERMGAIVGIKPEYVLNEARVARMERTKPGSVLNKAELRLCYGVYYTRTNSN